jgi:hypothetical protein
MFLAAATIFQNRAVEHSSITANQIEGLSEEISQIDDSNMPIEEFTVEDADATQISAHLVASHCRLYSYEDIFFLPFMKLKAILNSSCSFIT